MCRKTAIRLLSRRRKGRPAIPRKAGRKPKYQGVEFGLALKSLWKESGYMCERNLKAAMPEWLPALESIDGRFAENLHYLLLQVGAATIDRLQRPFKGVNGHTFTRPGQ